MNDSLSASSSYLSSTNSNSNSLNRSIITNGSYLSAAMSHNSKVTASNAPSQTSGSTSSSLASTNAAHMILSNNENVTTSSSSSGSGGGGGRISRSDFNDRFNVEYYLPNGSFRRRAKSQVVFFGDDPHTHAEYNKQLIEDLILLKKQLKEKDDQIYKLNDIRNKLESEIQELSASLFEEAYSMVNDARAEKAHTEKLLKEANGKIDVLQAEVKALKELVITSTPSTPNKHLHPHLIQATNNPVVTKSSHSRQSSLTQQNLNAMVAQTAIVNSTSSSQIYQPTATSTPQSSNTLSAQFVDKHASLPPRLSITSSSSSSFSHLSHQQPQPQYSSSKEKSSFFSSKSHKRAPSDIQSNSRSIIDKLFSSSTASNSSSSTVSSSSNYTLVMPNSQQQSSINEIASTQQEQLPPFNIFEFDTVYFKELVFWREKPELNRVSDFMTRVYRDDIFPCLNFPNKKLVDELLESIEANKVCIEELGNSHQLPDSFAEVCGLSNIPSICQYKIKFPENGDWIFISKLSRNRVISVCDFFTYLRYIKDGLIKSDIHEIYWNIIELRKKMALARLGL